MITVSRKTNKNGQQTICFQGHALFAPYGKDIVCAGVSSIFTTTVNAILKFDEKAISWQLKPEVILTIEKQSDITNKLIENMMDMLFDLEKSYPKNIKIREDEKDE